MSKLCLQNESLFSEHVDNEPDMKLYVCIHGIYEIVGERHPELEEYYSPIPRSWTYI